MGVRAACTNREPTRRAPGPVPRAPSRAGSRAAERTPTLRPPRPERCCRFQSPSHLSSGFCRPELTPVDKEIEEIWMALEPPVLDLLDQQFQLFTPRAGNECDRRAFQRRVTDLHDLIVGDIGDQADPLRCARLEMPAEAACQIEHRYILESNAVIAEHHPQPGDVGALCLRELVDVLFEKI